MYMCMPEENYIYSHIYIHNNNAGRIKKESGAVPNSLPISDDLFRFLYRFTILLPRNLSPDG